ncbi:hypothetical protein CSPX01_00120 [Colletotrichum filicis]|nr:hypothetical protein CSPX01_00120 [Colletotrichum filicis]
MNRWQWDPELIDFAAKVNECHPCVNLGQLLKPCTSLKDHVKAAIPSIGAIVKGSLTAAILADEMYLSRTAIITTTGAIVISEGDDLRPSTPAKPLLNLRRDSSLGRSS